MTNPSRRAATLSILSAELMTAGLMPAAACTPRPSFVDLSLYQTPIRNQGGRGTCITFGALAALEAACYRAGYGKLDLSEEFLNHFGKMFWLHPNWSQVVVGDAGVPFVECQLELGHDPGRRSSSAPANASARTRNI